MGKFKKDVEMETPELATTSLPDIIFMLLFFFMVTTSMRESTILVKQSMPTATEVKKLENKSLVTYISIGAPIPAIEKTYGTLPRIQLNDKFAQIDEIKDFIASERGRLAENDQKLMTTSLKIDENVKMGLVSDVKQTLRKCSALKISYATKKGDKAF